MVERNTGYIRIYVYIILFHLILICKNFLNILVQLVLKETSQLREAKDREIGELRKLHEANMESKESELEKKVMSNCLQYIHVL